MTAVGKKFSPRSVKAEQLTFDPEKEEGKRTNAGQIAEWSGGTSTTVTRNGQTVPQVVLESRRGTRVAHPGDYVVELSEGNFTVMSVQEFEQAYEK